MKVVYVWNGQEFSAEVESMPKEAMAYLLQNGWSQSLQDSFAGPRAKAINDGEDETTVNALIQSCIEKRCDNILAGKLTAGTGGGRDPIRSVAKQMLDATTRQVDHNNFGKKLPKDKTKLKALLDRFVEKHLDEIKAEIAERRKNKTTEEIDLEWMDREAVIDNVE